jgi:hypothetical protein
MKDLKKIPKGTRAKEPSPREYERPRGKEKRQGEEGE